MLPPLTTTIPPPFFSYNNNNDKGNEKKSDGDAAAPRNSSAVHLTPGPELDARAEALLGDRRELDTLTERLFPFLAPLANFFQRLAVVVAAFEAPKLAAIAKEAWLAVLGGG